MVSVVGCQVSKCELSNDNITVTFLFRTAVA